MNSLRRLREKPEHPLILIGQVVHWYSHSPCAQHGEVFGTVDNVIVARLGSPLLDLVEGCQVQSGDNLVHVLKTKGEIILCRDV